MAKKNKKYFEQSITDKNSLVLAAIVNNKIVGYFIGNIRKVADYRNIKKIAEGDNSYILSNYQRKGIGTEFYKRFLKWAKTKALQELRQKFLQKINNHSTGTRKLDSKIMILS